MKTIIEESKLGITEDNISKILSQACLLTELNIKGKKGNLSLERYLNINTRPLCLVQGKAYADMTNEEKVQVEAYKVGQKIRTTMSYLPKDILTKITTKQSNLRRDYYGACVAPNYMTTESYEKFKSNEIAKTTIELDSLLTEVELNWDTYLKTFKNDLLVKYPQVTEAEVDKLVKSLGTGTEFRNSYSIKLEYTPIPNSYSVQGMDPAYQKEAEHQINENAAKQIEMMIGLAFDETFQALNRLLISNNSLRKAGSPVAIASKTKGSVVNLAIDLEAKLGFLKIDKIDDLIKRVGEVIAVKDDITLVEETEICLSQIYNFMKDNELKDDYLNLEDSVLSEDLLEVYS